MNPGLGDNLSAEFYVQKFVHIYDKKKVTSRDEAEEDRKKKLDEEFKPKLQDPEYQNIQFLSDFCLSKYLDAKPDAKKQTYQEAGFKLFNILSYQEGTVAKYGDPEKLLNDAMTNAISNCILMNFNGQKSQLINMIYSDVRSKRCPNYEIIEKLYKMKYITETLKNDFY